MAEQHLNRETLSRYMCGELAHGDRLQLEIHLDQCELCTGAWDKLQSHGAVSIRAFPGPLPNARRTVEAGVRDLTDRARRKQREDRQACAAVSQLSRLPVTAWRRWLKVRPQLVTAGMAEALIASANTRVKTNRREALCISTLAGKIASQLTDRFDRPTMIALAANERATALRLLGQYARAFDAVLEASAALDLLMSAPDEKALVACNRASILLAMRRYTEARAALVEPREWFQTIADETQLARIATLERAILRETNRGA